MLMHGCVWPCVLAVASASASVYVCGHFNEFCLGCSLCSVSLLPMCVKYMHPIQLKEK